MNNAPGETPNLNLPPPVEPSGEQLPLPGAAGPEGRPEVAAGPAASAERASAPPVATPSPFQVAAPAQPAPVTSVPQTTNDVIGTSKSGKTKLIKDDDLIEKEWVDKAKRIVEQTREDPHRQSEQLTMVKADYMKKEYNKTIKVNE